jgi:diadenosine tetraphosphate (Ap4A) HIT family hydrolase
MNDVSTAWSLDPQLAYDSVAVGELSLSHVRVMNDANYPWLILVPRHAGAVEIIDLDGEQQQDLMDEIALLSQVLKDVTACDKLNVAAIGNVVPQLHVHIVRAPPQRCGLAAAGLGRSAAASLCAGRARRVHRAHPRRSRLRLIPRQVSG